MTWCGIQVVPDPIGRTGVLVRHGRWAFAILGYEMCMGQTPWHKAGQSLDPYKLYLRILKHKVRTR
jgi:hypothetical protein